MDACGNLYGAVSKNRQNEERRNVLHQHALFYELLRFNGWKGYKKAIKIWYFLRGKKRKELQISTIILRSISKAIHFKDSQKHVITAALTTW